ncbi:MAG TPA: sugar transferase [Candidatus Binataceae bacterium]|nr:sugar transferase [Candidatus Binataceae bacterium]
MIKRLFDLIFASILLIALSPLFLFVAGWIKLEGGGPVFYRGVRVGRYGKPFKMLKFRTMVVDADRRGASSTAADDERITGCGHLIRRYKIDELPQLLNVLRGAMSIVGPRPQIAWAVELYDPEQKRKILSVRPGITDYASIKFSNEAEILRGSRDPDAAYLELIAPEKTRLALLYVEQQSLVTDLHIFRLTLLNLLGVRRVAEDQSAISERHPVEGKRA